MKVFLRWYNCLVAPLTNPPVTYEGNLLQCFQCSVVTLTGSTQSKTLALVLSVGSDVSFYVRCCCCCCKGVVVFVAHTNGMKVRIPTEAINALLSVTFQTGYTFVLAMNINRT